MLQLSVEFSQQVNWVISCQRVVNEDKLTLVSAIKFIVLRLSLLGAMYVVSGIINRLQISKFKS